MNKTGGSALDTIVMMHFPSDTGFALGALEKIFYAAACEVSGPDGVHFSYPRLAEGGAPSLPSGFDRLVEHDLRRPKKEQCRQLSDYVREKGIKRALAFDVKPGHPSLHALRKGGATRVVAYFGSPLGTRKQGLSLLARRLRTALQEQPDLYVFESLAMQESAVTGGRGIPASKTTIIRTGLDLNGFHPSDDQSRGSFPAELGIPTDRKVVFYAGHTTPRKGIDTILDSATRLVDEMGRRDVHFLLCGDRPGEAQAYLERIQGTSARAHVTFGGYRDDIPELMSASCCGVIASTGWDSFPRSAMEMSASGLPLLASALQGLVETVDHGKTGYLFEPGDSTALADLIADLLDHPAKRHKLGAASRLMAEQRYSEQRQVRELAEALRG